MSYARRLHRGLDLDLIDRIEASGPQSHAVAESKTSRKNPRPHSSYRGWKRNAPRRLRAEVLADKRGFIEVAHG